MKHLRLLVVLLLAFSVLNLSPPPQPAWAQGLGPVLIHYYAWYAPQSVGPGKSPDWPITPYHSWDPATIQQHVSQIASAGIDGIVVAWYGPQEENNQTETNFRMILDQASANGIYALLSVDLGSATWFKSTQEIIDGLNYALSVHANHPAYFRYNGRPVLFFWFQGRYSLQEWAGIRQQVDPEHTSIWLAEGAVPDAMPTFDGLYLYTISWAPNVYGTLAQWGDTTRSHGGIWVATAMPGWDNTYTSQSERYIRERENGAFYRDTFSAAAASAPHMIVITSWNEWLEGTHIEPSHNYGDFYLNLTRELVGEYKAGGGVAGGGGSAPPVEPTPIPPAPGGGPTSAPGQSTPSPGEGAAAATTSAPRISPSPPSTFPPTITPTVPLTTATQVSIDLPTPVQVAGHDASATGVEDGQMNGGALRWASSRERVIIGGGLLAGAVGLLLLGIVGILTSRRHR